MGEFMEERIIDLIGIDNYEKLAKQNILIIGLGGVGGYTFEALLRSGIRHMTIVDFDHFEKSNLNRQIYALQQTIGQKKCQVALQRATDINPEAQIKIIEEKWTAASITNELLKDYDYIIDACDDVSVKIALIKTCGTLKKNLISCMGTANRTHPELLTITSLDKTMNDPLAKKIRTTLKNTSLLKTKVVWSREVPKKQKKLGTICSVPMSAGSLLASFIINDIIKNNCK